MASAQLGVGELAPPYHHAGLVRSIQGNLSAKPPSKAPSSFQSSLGEATEFYLPWRGAAVLLPVQRTPQIVSDAHIPV